MKRPFVSSAPLVLLLLFGCSDEAGSGGAPTGSGGAPTGAGGAGAVGGGGGAGGGDGGGGAQAGDCAAAPLDLEAYRSDTCFCGAACDCFLDIPYDAAARWQEGSSALSQTFDLYAPKSAEAGAAMVIWAHPNGSTKKVPPNGGLATDVAIPLLTAGRFFVSVEFRHPVVNAEDGAPPTDLARAIQTLRCHAATIGFDPARVAGIGRSRGTLLEWTAVQNDLADLANEDPVRRQSSRLLGVYAIQAQTSYWGTYIAETYFDDASQPAVIAQLGTENYGHAIGDVTMDDPPVHVVYDGPLEALPINAADCAPAGQIDCLHLPNFGDKLCEAYAAAGIASRCTLQTSVSTQQLLSEALPFLESVLQ